MNKKYLLYLAIPAVTLVAVGAIAIGSASAASTTTGTGNFMSNLVNAIATKFNLNPADVQQVFNAQKTQMQTQMQTKMQQKFTDKINQAVTDGKLTQAQANLILAKQADLQSQQAAFQASLQGETKTQVQAAMKAHMDALKQWATDNNIPLQYLMFGGGFRGRGGFGMGHRMGAPSAPSGPSTSPAQ